MKTNIAKRKSTARADSPATNGSPFESKCDCINRVDDELRAQNLKLVGYAFMMPNFRAVVNVRTDWVKRSEAPKGKKNSPPYMMATYCPWCGVKYPTAKMEND